MEHKDSTIIYESMFTAMELILSDDASWREAMTGLLRYGFYGEQPESGNPLVQAIWIQSLPAMKNAKDRYAKAVANGKKGGRPTQVTTERIMQLKAEGKTNKEIAELCGCSEKTIEGHITSYNKAKEITSDKTETYTDTYSESDTYSDTETETDTERFQGFLGCDDEQNADIGVNLDIINAIIGMYKQGKNYDQMKDKINKDFNQSVSGKQIHYIIDNRERYENEIEKDKKAKADTKYQQALLNEQKKHDTELARASEVVQVFKRYGVNVSEEQVRKRYTTDIIEGECGCCAWNMGTLIYFVEQWPMAYQGLEDYCALNEIIRDNEECCMCQSYNHMESKVSKKLKEANSTELNELLDIFENEEI